MRLTIRPSMAPDREIDVTQALIAAVAHQLHAQCGGNDVLNWLEAERFLARILRPVRGRARGEGGRRSSPRQRARAIDPERVTGPIPYL